MNELSPTDAHKKCTDEGYVYLDVRTEEEFADGHPEGAYNVPFIIFSPAGREPNADFVATVKKHFAPDTKIVVGCAAGGRSAMAIQALEGEGYTNLINVLCGFGGNPASGDPGWKDSGLPVSTTAAPGKSHGELK